MLPFSKRPPPPDEYLLRSGDFEAVRQDSYSGARPHHAYASNAPQPIPAAPRAPVFARQAAHTPYGYAQQQQQQTYGSGQFGDLSSPPPPNSLAPMAMGGMSPDSTGRNFAQTTSRTNGTIVVREKPSLKWGVMIALTGALLGGVLGLGMDARRQNARAAAAAADARDNAPPAMVAAALPNALTAAPRPAPAPVTPIANSVPAVGGTVIAPPPPATPAPAVLAAVQPVVVSPPRGDVAPKTTHIKPPPPKAHLFAAKVQSQPKPAPEKAEKADPPEPKIAKAEKAEKADPPEPKTKPKKDASTSDAMKILEAANKDTTNTL